MSSGEAGSTGGEHRAAPEVGGGGQPSARPGPAGLWVDHQGETRHGGPREPAHQPGNTTAPSPLWDFHQCFLAAPAPDGWPMFLIFFPGHLLVLHHPELWRPPDPLPRSSEHGRRSVWAAEALPADLLIRSPVQQHCVSTGAPAAAPTGGWPPTCTRAVYWAAGMSRETWKWVSFWPLPVPSTQSLCICKRFWLDAWNRVCG